MTCCRNMYDNRVASDYAIDKMKLLHKKNGDSVAFTIRLFQLVYNGDVRDVTRFTKEDEEKNELLDIVAKKIEQEYRQAYYDIEVSPENSITREYARRILRYGTPAGETHGELLIRFGVRQFLTTSEYYALLQEVRRCIETFKLEE